MRATGPGSPVRRDIWGDGSHIGEERYPVVGTGEERYPGHDQREPLVRSDRWTTGEERYPGDGSHWCGAISGGWTR